MPDVSFGSLLIVCVVAVVAPALPAAIRWLRVPSVVLELMLGIALGPAGIGWVHVDMPLQVLSLVGLAFLLFIAGLEIELQNLRGRPTRIALAGYGITLVIGLIAGVVLHQAGWVNKPLLLAVALSATSLGLVIPVLKDAGELSTPMGELIVASSTVADFGAILLLSLLFSQSSGGTASRVFAIGAFTAVIAVVVVSLSRAGRSMRFNVLFDKLQHGSSEIRVRLAVLLLIGFVALASRIGLESILGAFIAGAVLNVVDRDAMAHPDFRAKLAAIGYGFVIPIFFVTSGARLDLRALFHQPSAVARVPLFLIALVAARGLPALMYRGQLDDRRVAVAALLQATSLPFLVTAAEIGQLIGALSPVNAVALVTAGLVSTIVFPATAITMLKRQSPPRVRPTMAHFVDPITTEV
jgi:Kef-type K+ transport system membrane component KefB